MQLLLAFIVALAVTMALIPALMKFAGRWDMLDLPDARKVHIGGVPRVGGIGMVVGAVASAILWMPFSEELIAVLAAVLVLLVFGALDDKYELDYRWKFFGQALAAALAVIFGDVRMDIVPFFGMDPIPIYMSIPLTIIALVGATNAVNLSDGLDGLAGGIVLLSLAGMLVLAMQSDASFVVALSIIVIAVIFGFLRFNTHPAIIFMGDAGSQFLGFVIALLAIYLTQVENPALNPALPLLLIGVPILDTLLVMAKRIRAGRSPFSPDKNHLHHRLLAAGFAHYEAVFLIYIAQTVFVFMALTVRYEADSTVVGAYLLMAAGLIFALLVIESRCKSRARRDEVVSGGLTNLIGSVDLFLTNRQIPLKVLSIMLPALLISSPIIAPRISYDLVITAGIVGSLLLGKLVLGNRAAYISLRFLLYMVVAICAYLAAHRVPAEVLFGNVGDVLVACIVATIIAAGILAMRYDKSGAFKTTPTDFLVLTLTIALGVISKSSGFPEEFGLIITLIVVSFYAVEICLRNMGSQWNMLTIGGVAAMALVAVKGLYPESLSWF